jgi:hypothetical protein
MYVSYYGYGKKYRERDFLVPFDFFPELSLKVAYDAIGIWP